MWSVMKKITGFKQKDNQTDGCLDRANELNTFFNRFNSETSSESLSPVLEPYSEQLFGILKHLFNLSLRYQRKFTHQSTMTCCPNIPHHKGPRKTPIGLPE
ncbi:hypothetical protein ILYODFUR_034530 [Ilyodon furcidens]|uniref:Uncharacterized protein n=1 Tax=Ilyodon furcidens TaxID=33524 RepID=A0ABV0U1F8_9TELE